MRDKINQNEIERRKFIAQANGQLQSVTHSQNNLELKMT